MQTGIFAKTFDGSDALTVLLAAKAAGFETVQFNMACCGLPSMPDAIADTVIESIASAVSATGVSICALSATYNMIHLDVAVCETGLRRLEILLSAAAKLGIPLVTLCTGTRDRDDQWRHHPDNATPEAWADLVTEMTKAARLAALYQVDLGIEPEQANVVTNAEDGLRLIREIGSKHIRIVLDPANLFEHASPDAARTIVLDAVLRLKGHIAMAHAKDRYEDGRFATAGQGIVDFPAFLSALKASGFDGPVVTHELTAAEAPVVAALLKALL